MAGDKCLGSRTSGRVFFRGLRKTGPLVYCQNIMFQGHCSFNNFSALARKKKHNILDWNVACRSFLIIITYLSMSRNAAFITTTMLEMAPNLPQRRRAPYTIKTRSTTRGQPARSLVTLHCDDTAAYFHTFTRTCESRAAFTSSSSQSISMVAAL